MKNKTISVGDSVDILGDGNAEHVFGGDWGIVRMIDPDWVYVGMFGGDHTSVFDISELKKFTLAK